MSEFIQKKKSIVSGGNFHVRVILEGFTKKMFGILTHMFVILYGFNNIE